MFGNSPSAGCGEHQEEREPSPPGMRDCLSGGEPGKARLCFMCAARCSTGGCGGTILYAGHRRTSGSPSADTTELSQGISACCRRKHVALSAGAREGVALGLAETQQARVGAQV